MSRTTDVFVCGGGPAGLAAAIAARQRGFRVTLADCLRPPIDKACGEGLMPDSLVALQSLGVGLEGLPTGSFRGIRFLGQEHSSSAEFPVGRGIGIRRMLLHQLLVDRATELGVEMMWGKRIAGIDRDSVSIGGERVGCRWIVGADGNASLVRKWAGLERGRNHSFRIGLRRHFVVEPWSEFVEIYWGPRSQMYVTPIGPEEVCVALIARRRVESFDAALSEFPRLAVRLVHATRSTNVKGAPTVTRTLHRVTSNNVALVGEASGSSDAITGEGLAMGFRQAIALADAIARDDLAPYEVSHRKIAALPYWMARAMLLMDRSDWLRSSALRAFDAKPALFQQLLSMHVGDVSPASFGIAGALNLCWSLLTV